MSSSSKTRHPAKYSEEFLPLFADLLKGYRNVLDPMAGTCKISEIKRFGYQGKIYANELEREWVETWDYKDNLDEITFCDAQDLPYNEGFFDSICTSPTYGNRMADHHNAKDGSKRNTYNSFYRQEIE